MYNRIILLLVVVTAILILAVASATAQPLAGAGAHSGPIAEARGAFLTRDNPGAGGNHSNSADRPARSRNISQIGSNDLGGVGFNADVWALGHYAYVGNWGFWTPDGSFCPNNGTYVVDISDPGNSDMVATIPTAPGTQTNDVKVATVNTPHFSGDLLVVSNEDCMPGGARGFELWDVSDPTNAAFLGRFGPESALDIPEDLAAIGFGVHNNFIFEQGRRVYVASIVDFGEFFQALFGAPQIGDVRIVDVTDPQNPVQVADWGVTKNLGQGPDFDLAPHDVWVENSTLYVSHWDAGLVLLDVSDPSDPQFISQTLYGSSEEGNTHVAVPARGGNLVVVGDEDFSPGPWGFFRIFDTQDESSPVQISTYATENALGAPPPAGDYSAHNAIVRGNTAYLSWYSDGIQMLDISQPAAPRNIGSYVPAGVPDPFGVLPTAPELWGVYVQGDLILGSDMNAGLYILKHVP